MSLTETTPQTISREDTCSANSNHQGIVRHTILLRCFVYPVRDGCYLAECVDLDISAEAATEAAAKNGLYDGIKGYLNTICSTPQLCGTDEKGIRELILRPSPLTHRIRYHANRFLPKLGKRTEEQFFTFPAPCHC